LAGFGEKRVRAVLTVGLQALVKAHLNLEHISLAQDDQGGVS